MVCDGIIFAWLHRASMRQVGDRVVMMSNRWNRFIYSCWASVYDLLVRVRPIAHARRRAFEIAELADDLTILLVGVGTGEDLQLLPKGSRVIGIDISRAMLRRACRKSRELLPGAVFLEADAQLLPVADRSCDVGVLHLILSVVPDASRCLQEAARVLRPGGRLVIMDKFLPKTQSPSLFRRALNLLTRPFGTDINRRFEDMIRGLDLAVLHDQPVAFRGSYRVIVLGRSADD